MPPLILTVEVDYQGRPVLKQVADDTQKLATHVDSTTGAVGRQRDALGRFVTTGREAGTTVQGLAGSFQGATKSGDSFLGSLGGIAKGAAIASAAFAGFHGVANIIGSAVTSVTGFEAALANVNTLGIKSTAVQQQLREQLLQLPPVLGSATELGKGLYEVLSSGIEPAKAVAFLEQASLLAKAGVGQLDTAVIALTKTMAAYRLPVEDAAKVSDILFKAVEVGQGSLQQFAGAFPQVTQLSASMGISFTDTANAMATLTQTFRNADTAATGYRSLLQQLIQNSDQFLALGINIKQVISEQGLIGAVKVLQQVTQGSSERLRVFVNDVEGFNAAAALTGAQFQTLIDNQQKFATAAGSVSAAVKIQTATASSAWTEFVNNLERGVQRVGAPVLEKFTLALTGVNKAVSSVSSAMTGQLAPATLAALKTFTELEAQQQKLQQGFYQTGQTVAGVITQTKLAATSQEAYALFTNRAIEAVTGLDGALKQLGSKASMTNKQLAEFAASAVQHLEDMRLSGLFSAREINEAYERAVKVMRERFGELPPAMQAAYDRMLTETVDASGKIRQELAKAFDQEAALDKLNAGIRTIGKTWAEVNAEIVAAQKTGGTAFDAMGNKIEELGEKGAEAGAKVAAGFRRITEVDLAPITTEFPDDIAGITQEITRLNQSIASLINNDQSVLNSFGLRDYLPFVERQTTEWRKAIEILREKLKGLLPDTENAGQAIKTMAQILAEAAENTQELTKGSSALAGAVGGVAHAFDRTAGAMDRVRQAGQGLEDLRGLFGGLGTLAGSPSPSLPTPGMQRQPSGSSLLSTPPALVSTNGPSLGLQATRAPQAPTLPSVAAGGGETFNLTFNPSIVVQVPGLVLSRIDEQAIVRRLTPALQEAFDQFAIKVRQLATR